TTAPSPTCTCPSAASRRPGEARNKKAPAGPGLGGPRDRRGDRGPAGMDPAGTRKFPPPPSSVHVREPGTAAGPPTCALQQIAGPTPPCYNFSDRKSTRLNSSHVKISYAV